MKTVPPLSRLILHIGFHKTGTSSLQHFFRINREQLLQQGILYPHAGTEDKTAHHQIALQMNPQLTDGAEAGSILEALHIEQRQPHHTLLLSSEAFQRLNQFERLAEFVSHLNPRETLVIAYVREILDYRLSAFRQRVQNHAEFVTLESVIGQRFEIGRKLESWRTQGDLRLKWYDRNGLRGGDIIQDMVDQCGIDMAPLASLHQDMNPSLGGNLLYFRVAANAAKAPFLTYEKMRKLAGEYPEFRQPFHFSDADAARVRADNPYNAYLYDRLGPAVEKSWDGFASIPSRDTLERDFDRIAHLLEDRTPTWMVPPAPEIEQRWFGLGN